VKFVVTGARGLLGWHASARIHAANCAARYRGDTPPHELVQVDRATFEDAAALTAAVAGADAVLHFAGINRGDDAAIEAENPAIARALVAACAAAGASPHIVYANSVHAALDTPYGRSKRIAGETIADVAGTRYTDLVLPHIFGECARPYYNNVTATLIDKILQGDGPTLNPEGRVQLLHAGAAAQIAIDSALAGTSGRIAPQGRDTGVIELYERLRAFHAAYESNIFPDLDDPFDLALFNTYRTARYPARYPMALKLNSDARGTLFESAKGGNVSQSFLSTTHPARIRGDHFHTDLVERFLVVAGEGVIRIRRVLTDEIHEFVVSGDKPVAIDMPPLHTHHIENSGEAELLTFFWAHRLFDPANPDTFADPVIAA
jgi:UDP-2-acetamido-2,6-beta-L-arabino-hexul-4-ose reductase